MILRVSEQTAIIAAVVRLREAREEQLAASAFMFDSPAAWKRFDDACDAFAQARADVAQLALGTRPLTIGETVTTT